MSPHPTFFSLPKEVRLQIWALAYHASPPRVVALSTDPHSLPSPSPASPIYNVCREARSEARFQARKAGHLISLRQDVKPHTPDEKPETPNEKPKEEENAPPDFEVIFRYDVDELLMADPFAWPPRPHWADIPTPREKALQRFASRTGAVLESGWDLFQRRCTSDRVKRFFLEISTSSTTFGAEYEPFRARIARAMKGFLQVQSVGLVARAFRCLGDTERASIVTYYNSFLRSAFLGNRDALVRRRLGGGPGARKRRHDELQFHVDVCMWEGRRLRVVHPRRLVDAPDGDFLEYSRLFVKQIPDFCRAMKAYAARDDRPEDKVSRAVGRKEDVEVQSIRGVTERATDSIFLPFHQNQHRSFFG